MLALELSVSICSWNTREDLDKCLASLEAQRQDAPFEIIVVDNASDDGSAGMVQGKYPDVRLFRQSENLGFTGGHNLAIANRSAPHAFLLNSDTVVHPGALKSLAEYIHAHPEVGIVGPKVINPDGSLQFSCRRFPNPVAALFRNTPLGKFFPKNRFTRDYLMQDLDHEEVREVDWVSGAAMLLTETLIERVGVLDPGYFMYCEDVDICWRCWKAGLKVVYFPGAIITHAIGRSTDQVANRMIVRFHRSMLRFYRKHELKKAFLPTRPIKFLVAAVALTLRASLFLAKNALDSLNRKLGR